MCVVHFSTEISSKVEYYGIEHDLRPEDIVQKLRAAENMLRDIRLRQPFTIQRQLADEESDAAQDCKFSFCLKDTVWLGKARHRHTFVHQNTYTQVFMSFSFKRERGHCPC